MGLYREAYKETPSTDRQTKKNHQSTALQLEGKKLNSIGLEDRFASSSFFISSPTIKGGYNDTRIVDILSNISNDKWG